MLQKNQKCVVRTKIAHNYVRIAEIGHPTLLGELWCARERVGGLTLLLDWSRVTCDT